MSDQPGLGANPEYARNVAEAARQQREAQRREELRVERLARELRKVKS